MGWRIVLIPLAGVILVGSVAGGMAPQVLAQQTIALGAPKWDVGDQWAWQIGGDQITWTVLSASGEYTVQEKSARETGIMHVAADFSSTRGSPVLFLPQFYQLQFPLALGKGWTYTQVVSGSVVGEVELQVTRITEGVVSITVPGGTFDTVRIFGRTRSPTRSPYINAGVGSGAVVASGDFVVWYAPKVKQVVRITWQGQNFWPGGYQGVSLLLVSYKLHNP